MRARIKGFDTPFREIETLTMKGVNGTYFADDVEFEPSEQKSNWSEEDEKMLRDAIGAVSIADYYPYPTECEIESWLKSLKQRIGEYSDHWQDVRERAAIAAMQGVMNFFGSIDYNKETIAEMAVKQADALVEKLKGE